MSDHCLPIETGRFNNIPQNERVCPHCTMNNIGEEEHTLLHCTNIQFVRVRNIFLEKIFNINQSLSTFDLHNLFLYIISCKDTDINLLSCQFIKKMHSNP